MPVLTDPAVRFRSSFLAAVKEFQDDREYGLSWFVTDIEDEALYDEAAFERYVARLLAEGTEAGARAGFVPASTLWWTEGEEVLGRLGLRHFLTPRLERVGGHIGYDVRPSARRQGHVGAMLKAALPIAAELGITEALLTCDVTNIASRRVIEANGGRLIDQIDGKLRFRVPTS
jgi:predicted acetyltransferase